MSHKVTINVQSGENRNPVLKSRCLNLPRRLLRLLFGEQVGIMVLTPGATVEAVEIREVGRKAVSE